MPEARRHAARELIPNLYAASDVAALDELIARSAAPS